MTGTESGIRAASKVFGKGRHSLFRKGSALNLDNFRDNAANIGIGSAGLGVMIVVKASVGFVMASSGFGVLMGTTALASGFVGAGMQWVLQYRQALKNGTEPPKFWSGETLGKGLTTAANVASVGTFSIGKGLVQVFNQKSFKALFDWRDPTSWLKLGILAGSAYTGFSLWQAQDSVDIPGIDASSENQDNTSIEVFAPQDNADPIKANPGDKTLGFAEEIVGNDATPYLEERLQSADSNAQALKDLAHAFAHGEDGAPQDYDMARRLAEQAVESGNEQAKAFLADLDKITPETAYASESDPQQLSSEMADATADIAQPSEKPENLTGQQDNDIKTDKAEDAGQNTDQAAASLLAEAGTQIDETNSDYLQSALERAENGTPQGMKDLAHAYLTGRDGLEQNSEMARQLYEDSAARGNEQALRDLAILDDLGPSYFEDKYAETESQSTTPDNEATNAQKIGFCLTESFEMRGVNGNPNIACFFNNTATFTSDAYMTAHINGTEHQITVSPISDHENMKIANMDEQTRDQITKGIIAPKTKALMSNS